MQYMERINGKCSILVRFTNFNPATINVSNFFSVINGLTQLLLTTGLPSFNTVIHIVNMFLISPGSRVETL